MWFRSLFDSFKLPSSSAVRRPNPKPGGRRAAAARLHLEALEDRSLLSAYAVTYLGMPDAYSWAVDVNSSGQVVGGSIPAGGADHAVLWNDGTMIDLGTLGGARSVARAINDLGQIVGWAEAADQAHSFLLSPEDTNGDGRPDRWFRDSDGDGANDLMTALQLPPGRPRA